SGHGAAVGKDNWIVLVHGGLEGERVRVKIYRDGAGFSMADLLEVLETSPIRVEPRCKHFKECSVCTFQHVTYEEQLRRKHGVVKRAFDSLWKPPTIIDADGNAKPVDTDAPVKVVKVQDVIPSPLQYGYRTKMTPHYPRRAAYQPLEKIGFNGRGSKSVVDIEECPIVTKEIEDDFKALRRELIGSTSPGFANGSTLSFRHSLVLPKLHPVQQYSGDLVDCVNNVKFTFPAHSFFQNNSSILPEMTTYIRKCLRDTISAFGVNVLVDAYCGSGLFALSCAPDFEKVVGIEIDSKALDAASKNALNNSIGNAIFIKGSAERIYDEAFEPEAHHTAVIMDPPSKGAGEDFMQQLRQFNPKVIVYVSCNVHSQTRDLASLLRRPAGHLRSIIRSEPKLYDIIHVQPFDMFPQTAQVENIAILVRRD
ncbi:S-adenosyl-L-methionine-dependent methyltransferase, partial [Fimicolochytrium jonesii]|uniref:S-adenosyl-L-methionine-dependent methyltransferase n=1 Tax=Fimicolochytrium jonesii TaxID=1396493 RepID=UPI0022FDED61